MPPIGRRHRPPTIDTLVIALGAIVGVVSVLAVVLALRAYLAFDGQVARVDRQVARNDRVLTQIQDERRRNTLSNCEAQNTRNAAARLALRASAPTARESRLALTLVDALAPVRDCQAVLRNQVKGTHP